MKELGRTELKLESIDHAIHDNPAKYRQTVVMVKENPNILGCLITTHKMDLYAAANDLFDFLDPTAMLCGEISCISKNEGKLEGYALEPLCAGRSLDAVTGEGYFGRTGGELLIFGAGGAALATVYHLIHKSGFEDRPRKVIIVNRSQLRLDHMRCVIQKLETDIGFEFILNNDPKRNDMLMQSLPEHSIIINATGMGKDIPGSPITNKGIFPLHGIAWEFNYRGELDFLHQALGQKKDRNLMVEDGWAYFLHGWDLALRQILHLQGFVDLFSILEKSARAVRNPNQDLP